MKEPSIPINDLRPPCSDHSEVRVLRVQNEVVWCTSIVDCWFARGVGGIFALFLFQIVPARADVDEWLWVMNGDLPSIYLSFQDAPSVKEAFSEYVQGMVRWATYVRSGEIEEPESLPPVEIPETIQVADALQRRIDLLERILGPLFA